MFKKIIALFCILSILVAFVIPVSLASYSSESDHLSFWDYYIHTGESFISNLGAPLFDKALRYAAAKRSSAVCPESPDGWHHGSEILDRGQDEDGYFLLIECSECYEDFRVYGDDLEQGYNDYVSDNGLDGITSCNDGSLIYRPLHEYYKITCNDDDGVAFCNHYDGSHYIYGSSTKYGFLSGDYIEVIRVATGYQSYVTFSGFYTLCFPFSGSYSIPSYNFALRPDGTSWGSYNGGKGYFVSNNNITITVSQREHNGIGNPLYFTLYDPVIYITPSSPTGYPVIPQNIIVNDISYTVSSYDFSSRTFNVTNDAGDNISIEYGDNNYSVTNNTTNESTTFQYELQNDNPGSGSGSGSGNSTQSGEGGEEKESIWTKLGNLLGTLGSGIIKLIEAVIGKLLDALTKLLEMLLDKLKDVVELILGIFDYIPSLFNGFLDFLTAGFAYIPEEIMTLITFGIVAVVAIGIIRALRR